MDPAHDECRSNAGLWLTLLALTLLVLRLGSVPLLGPDEPRYARVAVEMHRAGEWVLPTLAGHVWMEKPVLYYWLAKPCLSILGEGELAVRLPSVLAGAFSVWIVFVLGLRLFGRATGAWAGLVMATALLPFAYSRAAAMDALLSACTTAAVGLGGLFLLGKAGRPSLVAAYALAALATLAKGPLGLVLPTLIFATYWVTTRRREDATRLLSVWGILAFLVVAGPWYLLITLSQGRAFIDEFILNHNLQRFTSTVHRHPGPIVYYLPLLVAGLFPWTAVLPSALAALRPRSDLAGRFLLVWLCAPLLLFSMAGSKLPGYILPCVAPLALMCGRVLSRMAAEGVPGPRLWSMMGAILNIVVALGVLGGAVALHRQGAPHWSLLVPIGLSALGLAVTGACWLSRPRLTTLLKYGAPGFVTLLALLTPPVLGSLESGKRLFSGIPKHEEVLVVAASRAAWMAGYFYHESRVRELAGGLPEALRQATDGPVLLLCGPGELRVLQGLTLSPEGRSRPPAFTMTQLRTGPHDSYLVRLFRRPRRPLESPPS